MLILLDCFSTLTIHCLLSETLCWTEVFDGGRRQRQSGFQLISVFLRVFWAPVEILYFSVRVITAFTAGVMNLLHKTIQAVV